MGKVIDEPGKPLSLVWVPSKQQGSPFFEASGQGLKARPLTGGPWIIVNHYLWKSMSRECEPGKSCSSDFAVEELYGVKGKEKFFYSSQFRYLTHMPVNLTHASKEGRRHYP